MGANLPISYSDFEKLQNYANRGVQNVFNSSLTLAVPSNYVLVKPITANSVHVDVYFDQNSSQLVVVPRPTIPEINSIAVDTYLPKNPDIQSAVDPAGLLSGACRDAGCAAD
jgi:hypothetical protein